MAGALLIITIYETGKFSRQQKKPLQAEACGRK